MKTHPLNPASLKAPFLPYDKIRVEAKRFLDLYHRGDLPVDIEAIIDCQLKINIVPVNSLRIGYDVEAFISNDFKFICIDLEVYEKYFYRYRFSLAHEVAHYFLHKTIYEQFKFSTIEEWKYFMESIPPQEYSWLELQAYDFAGLILVPDNKLKENFDNAVSRIKAEGYSIEDFNKDMVLEFVCRYLKEQYEVSDQVITKRLLKNNIKI